MPVTTSMGTNAFHKQIGNPTAEIQFEIGPKQSHTDIYSLEAGVLYEVGTVLTLDADNFTVRPMANGDAPFGVMNQHVDLTAGVAGADNEKMGILMEGQLNVDLIKVPTGDTLDRVRAELRKIGVLTRRIQYAA